MDFETIKQVAWLGDDLAQAPIRGVILVFHGLNNTDMRKGPQPDEAQWAESGGLVVFPYYGPWSWMNRQARAFVDELVTAVYAHFKLSADVPLISTGGSMGGHSALLYTRYAQHPVKACAASYPVCDFKFHFSERPDLPRTIYDAFRGYAEPLEDLFTEHSALSQVPNMPDIPYLIIHGTADDLVNKARHSDRLVGAMRERGLKVEYLEVPGMGHGDPPADIFQKNVDFVRSMLAR